MYYFRQNIKEKKLSKEDSKSIYMLFKTTTSAYNELIQYSINKPLKSKIDINSSIVKSSIHFNKLGKDLTMSIVMNFNINKSNFMKSDNKFNKPSFRNKDSEYFIYFSSRRFNIDYLERKITIQLNQKFITFDIPEDFALRKQNVKAIRLQKSSIGYYLAYEFQTKLDKNICILDKSNIQNSISPKKHYNKKLYKCGIDLGVDCLITAYSEKKAPLIISGKQLKYVNYQNNFLLEKLDRVLDKEKVEKIYFKRKQKINSIFNMALKKLFDYLNYNNIREIYVGDFQGVKDKKVARNFYQISFYSLIRKMKDYAKKNGIRMELIEESYTSKSSFLDRELPCFNHNFVGNREHRGLFITKGGQRIHADINGAAQILSKKHTVIDRSNVLLKPFYIDLVNTRHKALSRVESYLRKTYKRESKILDILEKWKHNPQQFYNECFISFDGINGHGTKEIAKYNVNSKKIEVNFG